MENNFNINDKGCASLQKLAETNALLNLHNQYA